MKASQTGLLASAVLLAMTMGLAPGAPGAHPFAPAMVYAQCWMTAINPSWEPRSFSRT